MSVIDEIKNDDDRKSPFYQKVVEVACCLHMTDNAADQTLLSAEQFRRFVSDLELQHRERSGVRRALTFAKPLIEGLQQYTAAVDVMIQADPTVSALIYGGAKLVLQLADGYNKYFEQIAQLMAEIGGQLRCFHIYTQEFAMDEYMNNILVNSYRDILFFWKDASNILSQRGKRFLVSGLISPFDEGYRKFKQKLDRNAYEVQNMANALQIKSQGAHNRTISSQLQNLTTVLEQSSPAGLSKYEKADLPLYREKDMAQLDCVRRWILGGRASKIDPQSDLDRHISSRHPGTCQWVFDDPIFAKWNSLSGTSSLWLKAAPGSGKSVLSASIIDKLLDSGERDDQKVIYFFCQYYDPDKSTAISALKSLAVQALKLLKYLPDELLQLYQDEYTAEDSCIVDGDIAERVLGCILKHIPYISIVVDGLDECKEAKLLTSLVRLRAQRRPTISKWFFTSGNDFIIQKAFGSSKYLTLEAPDSAIQADIRKFLEDNSDVICGTNDQLDRMTDQSKGNFLMARLTMDPFLNEELTCSDEFEAVLNDFRPELGRCWFRSLQRLRQRSEQVQKLAQMIFTAVVLAKQPMTFNELLDLLSVSIGEEPSSGRQRIGSVVLSACTPFVKADHNTDSANPTLRLVHKSVGDFLTQDPETLEFVTKDCYKFFVRSKDGNYQIGRRCVTFLLYYRYKNFEKVDLGDESVEDGLLKYASIFWYKHLDNAGASQELFQDVLRLLKSRNLWTCVRVQSTFAPHIFAKFSSTDNWSYRIYVGSRRSNKSRLSEESYAHALPFWIDEFDTPELDIVWGYQMVVREWGEVLVRYPDEIQQYFAKVLGSRSFWDVESSNELVKVTTGEEQMTFPNLLKDVQDEQTIVVSHAEVSEVSGYIKTILAKYHGDYGFDYKITIQSGGKAANLYRYKQNQSAEDDEDSSEDESSANEPDGPIIPHRPSIWFLSAEDSHGKIHWFHHVTKLGILQKSPPLFLPESSWLLWPKEEFSFLAINTDTWESSTINVPHPQNGTKSPIISQEYHYSPSTQILHQAAIYWADTNKFTIRHTVFELSMPTSSSVPPQITSSSIPSREMIWPHFSPESSLHATFYLHNDTLFIALGSPAVNIIRFPSTSPLSTSPSGNADPITVHRKRIFIPSSSYDRNLRFTVYRAPTSSSSQAIFVLDAAPKTKLPAVKLEFELPDGEWEPYDPDSKNGGIGGYRDVFLKGAYAAKDRAFSVPIRSGLDWRRSAYVTCW